MEQLVRDTPGGCPDQAYKYIHDTVSNAYNRNYPLVETRFRRDRHKVQPWMTDDIIKKISKKDKIYVTFRKAKEGSIEKINLKGELDAHNNEINCMIMEAKNNFYSQKINEYKDDMKKTWSTINQIINKKRTKTKYPPFF